MSPDSVWSDRFNTTGIPLDLRGMRWKSLMNKYLMNAELSKNNGSNNKSVSNVDPILVMNIRHKMVKESSKAFPIPQEQIQTDALKLLREEYHDRLVRQKEGRLVEAEIVKLEQNLESLRLVMKQKVEETNERGKAWCNRARCTQSHRKLVKGLGHSKGEQKMGRQFEQFVEVGMGSSVGGNKCDVSNVKVSMTRRAEENKEILAVQRKSLVEGNGEGGNEFWEVGVEKQKMKERFMEKDKRWVEEEFGREKRKNKVKMREGWEVQKRTNQKGIGHVLRDWKKDRYCKNSMKEGEGKMCGKKIEEFLLRLRENKMKDEKWSKMRKKEEKTDERLKKLMQEVKSSQKEAQEKLQRVQARSRVESKFLVRMEERREERARRRREFEDRKLRSEQEKEKVEREREEERRQKDEEEKRRRLEEVKEKQRAEKERREERKRELEQLRVKTGIAVAHYRVHLVRGYGLRPWMGLMKIRERQQQEAVRFFERRLKRRMLRRWAGSVKEQAEWKFSCALEFYEGILKRKCLGMWKESHRKSVKENQVAVDWYEFRVTETALKRWLEFTRAEQAEATFKRDVAVKHYQRKLKTKYMSKLVDYPGLRRMEQAKENRKWKWRQKVKEILPDYEPTDTFDNF